MMRLNTCRGGEDFEKGQYSYDRELATVSYSCESRFNIFLSTYYTGVYIYLYHTNDTGHK